MFAVISMPASFETKSRSRNGISIVERLQYAHSSRSCVRLCGMVWHMNAHQYKCARFEQQRHRRALITRGRSGC